MGKIQRMPRFTLRKEISFENQRNCIQKLCEISNTLWKRDMVPRPEWIGILQRNERAMMRNVCGVKLMDKKSINDLMQMLDFNETIDLLVKANSVHWYGHVLRKDKNNFMRRALDLNVDGTMKRGRSKKTWLKVVVERSKKVGLIVSDAKNRSRWRLGANTISRMMR